MLAITKIETQPLELQVLIQGPVARATKESALAQTEAPAKRQGLAFSASAERFHLKQEARASCDLQETLLTRAKRNPNCLKEIQRSCDYVTSPGGASFIIDLACICDSVQRCSACFGAWSASIWGGSRTKSRRFCSRAEIVPIANGKQDLRIGNARGRRALTREEQRCGKHWNKRDG